MSQWGDSFKRQFFAGLVIFVPISLTIYFFRLFYLLMSQSLFPLLTHQHWFDLRPSVIRLLSFILTIFLIWFAGVFASNILGRRLVNWFEGAIHYIPFFRGL